MKSPSNSPSARTGSWKRLALILLGAAAIFGLSSCYSYPGYGYGGGGYYGGNYGGGYGGGYGGYGGGGYGGGGYCR